MEEEYVEELKGLEIPVDREGAEMLYVLNAREVKYYPQDIGEAAMLFTVAKENWTMSKDAWDMTNLAMFAGDMKVMSHAVKIIYDAAEKLGVKWIGTSE
jgi:hypothetical protein